MFLRCETNIYQNLFGTLQNIFGISALSSPNFNKKWPFIVHDVFIGIDKTVDIEILPGGYLPIEMWYQ